MTLKHIKKPSGSIENVVENGEELSELEKTQTNVTMFASFTGACVEIGLCHAWATGMISYQEDFRGNFLNNLILGSLVTFWRIPHFHIMHRGMHLKRTTSIPDTGHFINFGI